MEKHNNILGGFETVIDSFIPKTEQEQEMQQLIEDEDKKKPYSDEALSKLLKLQGVDIARRTVAKYREVLDIPPTSQRKVNQVF